MNIALIGPSGSGKGTHATRLVNEFNLVRISTGDLFHENLERRTALGLLASRYLKRGDLVPDEVTDAMVTEWLQKTAPSIGLLFDGFPRTLAQAKFLDEALHGRPLDAVVYLKVSDETARHRLEGRMICSACNTPYNIVSKPSGRPNYCDYCGGELRNRPDDRSDLVPARLRNFHRTVGPVLDHYLALGRLVIVDAGGAADDVYRELVEALRAVRERNVPAATRAHVDALRRPPSGVTGVAPARPALNLVLLGGPGCGKGTQAVHLSREFKLPAISTGELFRANVKQQTELGQLAKAFMDRGELVPDSITESMVERRLAQPDAQDGFVLDGYPRTLAQAEALDEMLAVTGRAVSGAISIEVSDAETLSRLSSRRICPACQASYHVSFKPPLTEGKCDQCGGELIRRDDDHPDTIRARLKNFHVQIVPLAEHYLRRGLLAKVLGEGPPAEVTQRVMTAARSFAPGESTVVT